MTDLLGLHRTNSRVSIDSIVSFAGSINTKKAYKKAYNRFCKNLYGIGVTPDMINQKEREILDIFMSQDTATSSKMDSSTAGDQSELPVVSDCSSIESLSIFIDIHK